MKKLTLLLSAMLLACATNLWAATAEVKISSFSELSGSIGEKSVGISYETAKGGANTAPVVNGTQIRLYQAEGKKAGGRLILTSTTYPIVKVQIKSSMATTVGYREGVSDKSGTTTVDTYTANGKSATINKNSYYTADNLNCNVITLACLESNKDARIYLSEIIVTYALPEAAVSDPTISANDGAAVENNGFYTSPLTVTLACGTEGAEIHYTTDGSEPTAESATYSKVLTFTNEFVTLRAKAFKGEDASYEATANYYHNSSLEVPYTTTQAVALYNAFLSDVADVFVEGSVDGNPTYYESSSSSNYDITDGTTSLYIYSGKAGDGCGLADIANLVQGDNVVVNGTLTAYKGTLQLGKGNTIVKWTENTDPVLTCAESVAFGNISSLVGTAPSKTLEVTAKNLTEDITVTLSDGAAFVLDQSEFDVRNGGTLTITPVLTVGDNTATLTLTSGEKSVVVTLPATIKQAYTISWVVDNKEYTAGNPTTDVIEGEKVSVLPTAPADNTLSCSNIFVGWSTNNLGSTAGQTQPEDLFTSTGTAPVVTENTTYHAVFATAEGEAKEYFKETFDKNKGTGGNDDKWSGSIASSTLTADSTGWTFTKESGASQCAKLGSSDTKGVATTPALTGLTGSAVLTFRAGAWDGDANTLNLSISVGKLSEESVTLSNAAFSTYTITITDATAESKITFQGQQDKKARFFLDDVVVKNAVTLKDFRTNCEGVSTAISSAAVETPAVKSIENGQLVILRDGVKYNAMGVRLQ